MEHVKNKLQQRWTIIFFLVKAKNVGDAGHRRGFLTQNKRKRMFKLL